MKRPEIQFSNTSQEQFKASALELYRYQYENNAIYRAYCGLIQRSPKEVQLFEDIPFLPISFFKSHQVVSADTAPQDMLTFKSSGTTETLKRSAHYVLDPELYVKSFKAGFAHAYGSHTDYRILALLPSYQEQSHSSLIYMVDHLMEEAKNGSRYITLEEDFDRLFEESQKTLLIGVTFALLDMAEHFQKPLHNTVVMETGGMKGRRKELVRAEVHALLKNAFGVDTVHSEYGMTELLSQAYAKKEGRFECPPWMQIKIRETEDPFSYCQPTRTGAINVIDFANLNSCSFIATDDLGRRYEDGSFEVIGRFDHAETRGCNLMMA